MKADLHCHTNKSDGKLSIDEVVKLADIKGLDYLAITDHDTIDAFIALPSSKVKIIKGIELSTIFNNESVHLLGYFYDNDFQQKELIEYLLHQKITRENRAKEVIRLLKLHFDIIVNYEDIENEYGIVARPHIARAIVKAGYPYTYNQVFDLMISEGKKAYVASTILDLEEGIALLKRNNALVCLAHPVLLKKDNFKKIIKLPIEGIEGLYPKNRSIDTIRYLCFREKMIIVGGSDFHGDLSHSDLGTVCLKGKLLKKFLKKIRVE